MTGEEPRPATEDSTQDPTEDGSEPADPASTGVEETDPASTGVEQSDRASDGTEDPLPVATPGEAWCPVLATRTLLRNRWVPAIVARLLDGPRRFVALRESLPGVSAKVLSDTLDELVADGLVERRPPADGSRAVAHALTERGRSLEPVVAAMREWGTERLVPVTDPERTPVHA